MNKRNNGFTLIELIVVMAIIAVLAFFLAPQYLRYVEKSRVTVDCHTAAEILEATKVSAMDEAIYSKIPDAGVQVIWSCPDGKTTSIDCTGMSALEAKVREVIGKTSRSSKELATADWIIDVKQDPDSKAIACTGKWQGSSDDARFTEQSGGTVS